METNKIIELGGRRWAIISELSKTDLTSTKIGEKLIKPLSRLSTQLKELCSIGLIQYRTENDKRVKIYFLTERGRNFYSANVKALELNEMKTQIIPHETVTLAIKILVNGDLTSDLLKTAAISLRQYCSYGSMLGGGREELMSYFRDIMDDWDTYIEDDLVDVIIALQYYLKYQLTEEDLGWVENFCYPKLKIIIDNKGNVKGRLKSLDVLSGLYNKCINDSLKLKGVDGIPELFESLFFNPEEGEEMAEKCWENVWSWAEDKNAKSRLIDKIYEKSSSQDNKIRDRCIKQMKTILQHNHLSGGLITV